MCPASTCSLAAHPRGRGEQRGDIGQRPRARSARWLSWSPSGELHRNPHRGGRVGSVECSPVCCDCRPRNPLPQQGSAPRPELRRIEVRPIPDQFAHAAGSWTGMLLRAQDVPRQGVVHPAGARQGRGRVDPRRAPSDGHPQGQVTAVRMRNHERSCAAGTWTRESPPPPRSRDRPVALAVLHRILVCRGGLVARSVQCQHGETQSGADPQQRQPGMTGAVEIGRCRGAAMKSEDDRTGALSLGEQSRYRDAAHIDDAGDRGAQLHARYRVVPVSSAGAVGRSRVVPRSGLGPRL